MGDRKLAESPTEGHNTLRYQTKTHACDQLSRGTDRDDHWSMSDHTPQAEHFHAAHQSETSDLPPDHRALAESSCQSLAATEGARHVVFESSPRIYRPVERFFRVGPRGASHPRPASPNPDLTCKGVLRQAEECQDLFRQLLRQSCMLGRVRHQSRASVERADSLPACLQSTAPMGSKPEHGLPPCGVSRGAGCMRWYISVAAGP